MHTDPSQLSPVRRRGRSSSHVQDIHPTIPPPLSPNATYANLPLRSRKDGHGQGSRTAKSSSTSTSGYGPSSPRTYHDETDVDALLDPETSFNTTAETSWHTAPMHPTLSPLASPVPSSPILPAPLTPGGPIGFLGHRIERDPLVELSEVVETNRRFIDALVRLDDTAHEPGRPGPTEPIEVKMQKHLERLHEADRAREEQCRHLAVLARDVAWMRWDEAVDPLIDLLDVLPIYPLAQNHAPEEDIGWVGETRDVEYDGRHGMTPDPSLEPDPYPSPIDIGQHPMNDLDHLLSPSSDSSSHLALSPTSRPTLTSHRAAPLPSTTRNLLSSSNDLLATLAGLGDAIRQSASASAGSSRRIRGLTSSIDSWRERETLEEQAKTTVEAYERRRLESELRAGSGLTVKEQLEREMASFEEVLDSARERMDEVTREAAFRVAVV